MWPHGALLLCMPFPPAQPAETLVGALAGIRTGTSRSDRTKGGIRAPPTNGVLDRTHRKGGDIVIALGVAQIIVRNLDDATKEGIKRLAKANGRSAEAEAREILRNAVRNVDQPPRQLGSAIAALFAGSGADVEFVELRGQEVRAAVLEP